MTTLREPLSARLRGIALLWLDSWAARPDAEEKDPRGIDWARVMPFIALHLACLAVIWVGWSWFAVGLAAFLYGLRMFAVTAFYHRFFSHRAFRTSRPAQFLFALLGAAAVQRGPLWWAAHHRAHHRHSDADQDLHSPEHSGFWWSHVGWILANGSFRTRVELVPDFARFRELRFLDRFDWFVPLLLMVFLYGAGEVLRFAAPALATSGAQLLVWGFCISTVVLYHCTFSINSIAHRIGSRRYATDDESRNNFLLSVVTLGEGWHNNHHFYPNSARQGFRWWELDVSYYLLVALARIGLIWDLRQVPERVLVRGGKS